MPVIASLPPSSHVVKEMQAPRKGDKRRLRSMPPTFSTDKHPPGNHRERPSPFRPSERIRKVETHAMELVPKVWSPSSDTLFLRLAELAANTLETRKGIDMPIPSITRLLSLQSAASDNDKGAPFVKRLQLTDGPEPSPIRSLPNSKLPLTLASLGQATSFIGRNKGKSGPASSSRWTKC